MSAILTALIASSAAIVSAVGTILVSRQQEKHKQQVFLTEKVDEIIDERVSELRADRDRLKIEADHGWQERNRLSLEVLALQQEMAVLKTKLHEIELHRAQAITRMRHEVRIYSERYMVLLTENAELRTKLGMPPHEWDKKSKAKQ